MISRRGFVGAGAAIFAARAFAAEWKAPERNEVRGGFDEAAADQDCAAPWQPYSDRKVKVGIAGEGVCNFGSAFGYQNHPNVEVVACTDLNPEKCRLLQERTGAKKRYYVEPVALVLNEDTYYLMTYSSRHPDKTANYRLDRMDQVEVVDESVLSDAALEKIAGVAEFTEQAFKMYGGELVDVLIQFDKTLIGPVLDKFGEDTPMMTVNENTCAATVHVQISPTFFGWVAQFAEKMRIISPDTVIEEYKKQTYHVLAANLLEAQESRRLSKIAIIIAIISVFVAIGVGVMSCIIN